MNDPFRQLITVTEDRAFDGRTDVENRYDATIDAAWTIGPKVHGGVMMAVCASAAVSTLGADVLPLAVSASYLSAPDPGAVSVHTIVRKRGRTVSHVDVVLSQGGVTAVRAVVTLGLPDTGMPDAEPAGWTGESRASSMAPEPPADAETLAAEHPMSQIVHLAQHVDMRIDTTSAAFLTGGTGEPEIRMWIRARPGDEDDRLTRALFAIMGGDICPPVTMNRGSFGWAPTVQLTTYLRRLPAPGWLRVVSRSEVIGDIWFEEDHTIVDSSGAVVVQSRQLAMVPRSR